MTVLLIDDSRSYSEALSDALARRFGWEGCGVIKATEVTEALDWLRRNQPPLFVLADRYLHDGCIEESLALLRDASGGTPVVVCTSVGELGREEFQRIIDNGAARILDKGWSVDELVSAIEDWLRTEGLRGPN